MLTMNIYNQYELSNKSARSIAHCDLARMTPFKVSIDDIEHNESTSKIQEINAFEDNKFIFPSTQDEYSYELMAQQHVQFWYEGGIEFDDEKKDYQRLAIHHPELVNLHNRMTSVLVGVDLPVLKNLTTRVFQCCKTPQQFAMVACQVHIECIHSIGYSEQAHSSCFTDNERRVIMELSDTSEACNALNDYVNHIIRFGDDEEVILSQCCYEMMVVFDTMSKVFTFNELNMFEATIRLNQAVSEDERLHGKMMAHMAKFNGFDAAKAYVIIERFRELLERINHEYYFHDLEKIVVPRTQNEYNVDHFLKYNKFCGNVVCELLGIEHRYPEIEGIPIDYMQTFFGYRKNNPFDARSGRYRKTNNSGIRGREIKLNLLSETPLLD